MIPVLFIGLLAVVGGPHALAKGKVGKCSGEAGVLGAAGVNAKLHGTIVFVQMADAHLTKMHAIN